MSGARLPGRMFARPIARWLPCLILLAPLGFACGSAGSVGRHSAWESAMARAAQHTREFELSAAATQYELALRLARTPKQQIRSRIAAADLMAGPVEKGLIEPLDFDEIKEGKTRRQAARLYRDAITIARKTTDRDEELDHLETTAVNNFATLLFLQGRFSMAARLMGETLPRVSHEDLPNYLFNYGATLEKAARPQDALDIFLRGGRLEVGRRAALGQAVRLALEVPETRLESNQARLVEVLLGSGDYPWAAEVLEELLAQPSCAAPEGCPALLAELARYLVAAQVDAAEFERRWWPLASSGPEAAPTAGRFADLHLVYSGELPVVLDAAEAEGLFPAWASPVEDRRLLAGLLATVADQELRQRRYAAALPRYALAWALDRTQTHAALYFFHLLSVAPRELDPGGEILLAGKAKLETDDVWGDAWPPLIGPAFDLFSSSESGSYPSNRELYLMAGDAFASRADLGEPGALELAVGAWSQGLADLYALGPVFSLADFEARSIPPLSWTASHAHLTPPSHWLEDEEKALALTYLPRVGEAHARLGDTDAAVRDYLQAYEILGADPADPQAIAMLEAAATLPPPKDPELSASLMAYLELTGGDSSEPEPWIRWAEQDPLWISAADRDKERIWSTESGLQYEILTPGDGPKPTATDRVTVHYVGTLLDGTRFDSSLDRGQPVTFDVGNVIPGWTEALQMMRVGSKWKLYIPPDLAYGERGQGPIPPNSTLVFEVQLLSIGDAGDGGGS